MTAPDPVPIAKSPATHRPVPALARAFAAHYTRGTVTVAERLTPTMQRIGIVADGPITQPYTPGQHVRIQINDPLSVYGILRPVETLRTYTVWRLDPDQRTFELRVHLYDGTGIGRTWALDARPGDAVTFWGPQGTFATRPAEYHVFAGDETATAAFVPMIEALPPDARIHGVVESESPADDLAIPGGHHLRRVHRHGAPAFRSPTLVDAMAGLDLPAEPGAAYIAGEARTCQQLRDHLVHDRGWPRRAVTVTPFWTPGKRGLH